MVANAGDVICGVVTAEAGAAVYAVVTWNVSVEMGDDVVAVFAKRCWFVEHFKRTDWALVVRRNGAHGIDLLYVRFHFFDGCSWASLSLVIASYRTNVS